MPETAEIAVSGEPGVRRVDLAAAPRTPVARAALGGELPGRADVPTVRTSANREAYHGRLEGPADQKSVAGAVETAEMVGRNGGGSAGATAETAV